jgi:hypothetical protein
LGTVVMPCYVLFELLAPVVEATGLIVVALGLAVGATSPEMALLLGAASLGLGFTITVISHWIDGDDRARSQSRIRPRDLLGPAAMEQLVFRPLATVWKLAGLVSTLGRSRSWGYARRRGFSPGGSPPPATVAAVRSGGHGR